MLRLPSRSTCCARARTSSRRLLADVATAPHPPRVIAVYRRDDLPAWEQRPATLALWRLADPGNVGTLIRTADAFGAAVVLSEGCADPTVTEGAPRECGLDLARAARDLGRRRRHAGRARGARRASRSPSVELAGRVTFLLGAERAGLPAEVERDVDATIPIAGAESLNVAATGAIALYEWSRASRTVSDTSRCQTPCDSSSWWTRSSSRCRLTAFRLAKALRPVWPLPGSGPCRPSAASVRCPAPAIR